jgi:integrase/recombinase XerD
MRTPSVTTKNSLPLKPLITATAKLWRRYHLTYDQARYVTKEVRKTLGVKRLKVRKRVIQRLACEEEQRLIQVASRGNGEHGLLIKTLFHTGARLSEFVNIKVEDFFLDKALIGITKGKGGKSRYVPILPELAPELKTHVGSRSTGYLFLTNRHFAYAPRRIQQIVKAAAATANIKKRGYPHLLRHSVATTLLEQGMPIE